ncbi:MAG: bifunctional metallophosphatase/5'-nucleotidase [Daejeonella sp.]|uniref:bifunctional metallophosphatase/5'-nucleotidase n=1 Tax=Daejeonella sp. TaxID=2805397 RepID=UPI003C7062D7
MKLSIAFVNDVHGYLEPHPEIFLSGSEYAVKTAGGYSRLQTLISDIRRKNQHTIVFDGGDTFHGTLPIVATKGEALVPILNQIGFDAMVGHWDFAYGPQHLLNLAGQLSYPILAINIYDAQNELLLKPYVLQQIGEIKVATIGICSNIIDKTMPKEFSEGIRVSDGIQELPKYIQEVKKYGADLIILLSHSGFPQDFKILSQIEGIDICLSAHTHNRLFEPVIVNDTIIIQCGCHGSFLGHLELELESKKVRDFNYELIEVDESILPDLEMEKTIQNILKPYHQLKTEVIGETSVVLHRYDTLNSSADHLLLSAVKEVTKADVCFSNGWRYGAPISAGPVTKWDIYNLAPMDPVISTLEMKGIEIVEMLEENLERTFSSDPSGQMGGYVKRCLGLTVYMRIENPKGHRIQQIFIGNEVLRKEQVYKVGYITSQGVPEKFGQNRQNTTLRLVEAVVSFLAINSPFQPNNHMAFHLV